MAEARRFSRLESNEITGATSERLVLGNHKSLVAGKESKSYGGETSREGLIYAAFENARPPSALRFVLANAKSIQTLQSSQLSTEIRLKNHTVRSFRVSRTVVWLRIL